MNGVVDEIDEELLEVGDPLLGVRVVAGGGVRIDEVHGDRPFVEFVIERVKLRLHSDRNIFYYSARSPTVIKSCSGALINPANTLI